MDYVLKLKIKIQFFVMHDQRVNAAKIQGVQHRARGIFRKCVCVEKQVVHWLLLQNNLKSLNTEGTKNALCFVSMHY